MATKQARARIAEAIEPLKALSLAGYKTTIIGPVDPATAPGDGLSEGAIELLAEATKHPNLFIDYAARSGIELFEAGLMMIYVTSGEALYEPTALATREGQQILAEHRREAEDRHRTLRALWRDFIAVDPDADRRRDLVAYDEVLREFGPEIANTEARPPIEHRRHVDAAVAKLFADIGYVPDNGRAV